MELVHHERCFVCLGGVSTLGLIPSHGVEDTAWNWLWEEDWAALWHLPCLECCGLWHELGSSKVRPLGLAECC